MKKNHPFLKIAGVKNIDEFYQKFPTEESFMAKYGKQLKKAAPGIGLPVNAPKLPTLTNTFASTPTPSFGSKVKSKAKAFASGIGKGVNEMVKPLDLSTPGGVAGIVGGIGAGINTINQTYKNIAELDKYGKISDVALQAANTRPERIKNRYVRPEDNLIQGSNPLGTGTNYLAAENGAEIANTYAPNVMYTDLGYEPLNDSNVKQYKKGGKLKKAAGGADIAGLADTAADIAKQSGQLGGGLGSQWGGAGGETGGYTQMLGGFGGLGGLIGGLLDAPMIKKKQQAQAKLDANTGLIGIQQGLQNEQSAFMKDGGWVSNDWQPQVIASFGEHSMKQLLKPDPTMNTLRAGGHLKEYTAPSASAMYTGRDLPYQMEDGGKMAMGGDLQVHRGKAETISYNPFLPNGGETVMFKGPSHDNGGMPISYGQNGVEVEGGEPAQVMKDGGTQDNLVVFGNMYDPVTGMKFKKAANEISKVENKQNKVLSKSTDIATSADDNTTFGKIELATAQALEIGAKMKLKPLALEKLDLAARQTAILDTAEERGMKPEDIKFSKSAKFGGKFSDMESFAKGGTKTKSPFTKKGAKALASKNVLSANIFTPRGMDYLHQVEKEQDQAMGLDRYYPSGLEKPMKEQSYNNPPAAYNVGPMFSDALSPEGQGKGYIPNLNEQLLDANSPKPKGKSNSGQWSDLAKVAYSSIYPFFRPTAARPLDPNQLAPAMLAASTNQLEPVQAQSYIPMLSQATKYSFQDQLNEITAQSRAAEKLAVGNPYAAAALFAQAAQAKTKVLADEFRMNQSEQQRIAEANRAAINDANLKNLSIFDQQYARQAQAKSNTKQQRIEIAKDIANKYAQNKSENMKATVMENMYPKFNFTQEGRIYKDPLAFTSLEPGIGTSQEGLAPGLAYTYDENRNIIGTRKLGKSEDTPVVKNGGIVKAFKNF